MYQRPGLLPPPHEHYEGDDSEATVRRWIANSRALWHAGATVSQVWVLPDPLTEFMQGQLDIAHWFLAVGEQVRVLPEDGAIRLDLPDQDFWIIDDAYVALLAYDTEHVCTGAELIYETATMDRYRVWRDLAWEHATPPVTLQSA